MVSLNSNGNRNQDNMLSEDLQIHFLLFFFQIWIFNVLLSSKWA